MSSVPGTDVKIMGENKKQIREPVADPVAGLPAGAHVCLFYREREDLLDVLVPYFTAGLKNNEFCIWVVSEHLNAAEAEGHMRRALPDFDRYMEQGQMKIVPHARWYVEDGAFNKERVLSYWTEKLRWALSKKYNGMRVTGDTSWVERIAWADFTSYEEAVDSTIGKRPMKAICSYAIDKCDVSKIMDITARHRLVITRSGDKWEIIESTGRKAVEQALRAESNLEHERLALERKTVALSEIVAQIEIEKDKIKDDVAANVRELCLPLLERLGLKGASRKYARVLRHNLEELTSAFGRDITTRSPRLTRREIEICDMVRSGLASKEISSLLNLSLQTVAKHRKNIRHKLRISNRSIDLSSFLRGTLSTHCIPSKTPL